MLMEVWLNNLLLRSKLELFDLDIDTTVCCKNFKKSVGFDSSYKNKMLRPILKKKILHFSQKYGDLESKL